jgi:hypothetical protein
MKDAYDETAIESSETERTLTLSASTLRIVVRIFWNPHI